jgi:hypothetical protein
MSHLNHQLDEVPSSPGSGTGKGKEEDRRRSMESPGVRPGIRRSGTLPSFLEGDAGKGKTGLKEVVLPVNPSTWTRKLCLSFLGG